METHELLELEADKLRKKLASLLRKRERIDSNIADQQKRLDAISVVLGEVLNVEDSSDSHSDSSTKRRKSQSGAPSKAELIRMSLAEIPPGTIDYNHLYEVAESIYPGVLGELRDVLKTMSRLLKDDTIEIDECRVILVEPGKGARPAVYKKLNPASSPEDRAFSQTDHGRQEHESKSEQVAVAVPFWRRPAPSNQP